MLRNPVNDRVIICLSGGGPHTLISHIFEDEFVHTFLSTDKQILFAELAEWDPLTSQKLLLLSVDLSLTFVFELQKAVKSDRSGAIPEIRRDFLHSNNCFEICLNPSFFLNLSLRCDTQEFINIDKTAWKLPLRLLVDEPIFFFHQQDMLAVWV